jgi:hypothetical protein
VPPKIARGHAGFPADELQLVLQEKTKEGVTGEHTLRG